ncbi:MAG: hypothetical protein IJN23_03600 [Akkermansia sp.]|nr:hypothetical protein [Akkermansia sp.]
MTYTEKAIAGTWYTITCTAAATVTQEIEGETATLATLDESGTASFRATSPTITIETTGKYHILPTKAPAAGGISSGGATGEQFGSMMFAGSDDGSGNVTFSADLTVKHATWFDNSQNASKVRVIPATWKNEVMTCYLKTAVPVSLSGVIWLYGTPFMSEGYVYVIALQQIDADTVLANLAYSVQR